MKKLFALLTMLCMTTVMSVATNYDLWIKGTRVTSSNASDILGTKAASYNASTKTLTLNQSNIESSTDEVIYSRIEGLTINVNGTVYLRSTNKDKNTVSLSGTTTITGTSQSSLTITRADATAGTGYQPIRANCDLDIQNLTMRVSNLNGGAAIRPLNTPDDTSPTAFTLSIKDANVTFAAGGTYYPIYGFKKVSISGCSLNPMTYYKNDAGSYYVADNSGKGISGKDIVIKNRKYGAFGNVTIDDTNASSIKPSGMTKGTAKLYNFANGAGKYLYLEDVSFSSSSNYGIRVDCEEPCHFEIIIKGNNYLKSTRSLFIASNTPGTVYVKASQSATTTPYLDLESTSEAGIDVRCPGLNFQNIDLVVSSEYSGIDGFQGYDQVDHTLRFSNTTAMIRDNSTSVRGAIRNFKSVSYTDCYYFGPSSESLKNNTYCNHKGEKLNFIRVFRGYGILINGVQVTNDNKDDVFKDGKVSYNSSTKTLNLKGVSYEGSYGYISVYNPITINLSGKNTFKPTSPTSALNLYANTKIIGSSGASLSANTDNTYSFPGITVDQADLTIKDCQVSVNSPNAAGVKGAWPVNYMDLPGTSTLTVDNASLLVSNSSSVGCIRDFKKVTMTDCYCERPSGATYDTSYGYFKNGESIVTGNLEICKGYGVIVGGIRVTKDNASNVMSGVSYDASSNTLKLNNAKVSTTHYGIVAYKDLNLNVSGTANSISSSELHGILAYGDLNIYGSDKSTSSMSLTTSGYNYAGIYMNKNGKKFNVKNTTLTARASSTKGYGIVGSKTVATIQNADVTAYGNSASIYDIKSLSMIGVEIITPANALFTPGVGITVDGNAVAGKDVKIGVKEYDIYVGGTKLTSANCADLTGDGKIKYDPSTNTLTLTNASIATEGYGISAQTKQRLYINLVGTNYVVSQRSYALYHNNTNGITIQSSSNGTLNLSGSYVGSYQEGGNLTVKNCTVKVNGMQGKEGNNYNTITIENANVTSECSFGGAFKWIDNILLTKCYVSEPVGAVFDSGQGGYLSAGTICNKVVIKAGTAPTAIDGVTLDNDNAPAYDLRGVQVDKNYKGIVIKNGKKYMQK